MRTMFAANSGWPKAGKNNGLRRKDLLHRCAGYAVAFDSFDCSGDWYVIHIENKNR